MTSRDALTDTERGFVVGCRIARLATADDAGHPHAVPVCFALLDNTIFTPIDEKPKRVMWQTLRRVRNVEARHEATILFDAYDEDWSNWDTSSFMGQQRWSCRVLRDTMLP